MTEPVKDETPHTRSDSEAISLAKIHNHINTNTPCGIKIREAFACAFPDTPQFTSSVISGGNRSTHHDFQLKWEPLQDQNQNQNQNQIEVQDIIQDLIQDLIQDIDKGPKQGPKQEPKQESKPVILKSVEFKGSKYNKQIDATKQPWLNGVQFYNGTGKTFSVGLEYAKQFYDKMMDEIIVNLNISVPKPSYEEWSKDAFIQGKPKTAFVKELREKGYKGDYLSDCRKKFNSQFVLTPEQLEVLKAEVYAIANQALLSKDYWLQIHGAMEEPDDFEVRWTGKIEMPPIVSVEQEYTKSACDVNFKFVCEDGSVFHAKLRWGYGQCITNIRLDIK